ncbi:ATP-dependent DNA helicase RecG [Gimesia maris]|uniref:ATP-dependent DNA helicase RecG n=1 Tax=Gimesia maris TaxID=122 RepID=UPI00241CDA60|nr:ATP-dependent DNA helicase RecG [Gimesia maris]|tara:strand:- start:313824 stop:315899 length:2076 start_codon:yes stop_codon:yes gene_type:complete
MTASPLETPVQFLNGVGPDRGELLGKLGIQTVEDLLWHLPRSVLDLTDVRPVNELEEDQPASVCGKVVDLDARTISRGRTITAILLDCGTGFLKGTWFNQPWVIKRFFQGQLLMFSGKPKRRSGKWEISHPQFQVLEEDLDDPQGLILPRYSLTEGIKMYQMRRFVRAAVEEYAQLIPDYLPESFREAHSLIPLSQAVIQMHKPRTMEEYHAGVHRVIYDDLLEFQLALALRRRLWTCVDNAPLVKVTAKVDARIRRLFPYDFTEGQNQAIEEIKTDLASGRAMHRMLQADVGAGKTAIAIYAMLAMIAGGNQAVLMAPTELLAVQHWETINQILKHSRVKHCLLTGSLSPSERKATLEQIASGEQQLIVGTQAVVQKDVRYHNLGLVIIDEQHKFGVMQRAHFSSDQNTPHMLVMTATPIPRSLCLTQFGELDISVNTELPPGRQPVMTSRVSTTPQRKKAWDFLRTQIAAGRQAYIVCPRIDSEDEQNIRSSAEEVYRKLQKSELSTASIGLVHGQMDREERAEIMRQFHQGTIQVLVSTTVVEVGVDVPNATLMVILQADRFGLSQLHQLRGRVSRGLHRGNCFLFSYTESEDALNRLSVMEQTTDGFEIAEADFQARGPGDIFGTRQHGELPLRVADLKRDAAILQETHEVALRLVERGEFDQPRFAPLKIRVLERFGQLMDLGQSG